MAKKIWDSRIWLTFLKETPQDAPKGLDKVCWSDDGKAGEEPEYN